jgi:hypothetical protein
MAESIQHLVLTRFAVRSTIFDSQSIAKVQPAPLSDGWLEQRFTLFEQYCLPSLQAQTMSDFRWRIYVHAGFDPELMDRLRAYDPRIEVATAPESPIPHAGGILATTRIDSDDGFSSNALATVQRYGEQFIRERQPARLLRLKQGWWVHHQRHQVYQCRGWSFLTLFERRAPYRGAMVCSCDDIAKRYPEWTELKPLWLRIVHGNNVKNRFDPKQPTVPLAKIQQNGFAWLSMPREVMRSDSVHISDHRDSIGASAVAGAQHPADNTAPGLPRIALIMRTTDRRKAERPVKENYLQRTVAQLVGQGVRDLRVHGSKPSDQAWIAQELGSHLLSKVQVFTPDVELSANANALAALDALDFEAYDWVLLLEDDLLFCSKFVPSVQRWLLKHGAPDRNVFRFFGFVAPLNKRVSAFDHSLKKLRASQVIALRVEDARDFLAWGHINLPTWRGKGPLAAKPGIAFDKFVAAWSQARWPNRPGVLSWPYFVDHIGVQSSLHVVGGMNHVPFAGTRWSYGASA